MKIRLRGIKSLIKAIRNRDHLVPVITLISGKTKTFYAKRYVSPGEAMVTAKEDFKINPYQEAIFESKDGKRKNITEKEVLEMYDAAGKPGVLQDFIKQNFKKPKIKASTKDNGQLSFDNMMQGSNGSKISEKELGLTGLEEALFFKKLGITNSNQVGSNVKLNYPSLSRLVDSQKTKLESKITQDKLKGTTLSLAGRTKVEVLSDLMQKEIQRLNFNTKTGQVSLDNEDGDRDKDKNLLWFVQSVVDNAKKSATEDVKRGNLFALSSAIGLAEKISLDSKDNGETLNKAKKAIEYFANNDSYFDESKLKPLKSEEAIKVREDAINSCKELFEELKKDYNYTNISLDDLLSYYDALNKLEEDFATKDDGYWLEEEEEKESEKQETNTPSPYGKLTKYQFRRLQQKGAALWDKNGEKRLYFNDLGLELAEKVANETNASSATQKVLRGIAGKLFYDMNEGKFYSYFNENQREKASYIFDEARNLLEQLKQEETTDPKDINRLSENPNLTASQEQALLEKLGVDVDTEDMYSRTRVKPDIRAIEELIGKRYSKIGDESYSKAATRRINETLYNLRYDVGKNEVIGDTNDREGIRDMVQKAIDNLIEDLKRQLPEEPEEPEEPQKTEEPEKEIEKLAFRSVGLSGGLIRYNALRKGTTKIESKNEYKPIKNINELVKQVKPIKDAHTNIKGRAIMDMFGISADLYTKANNIPFPMGPGAVGYCTRLYDEQTGVAHIFEIGLVADRNNSAAETKTAIHECMHAKIGMSGKNKLLDAEYGKNSRDRKALFKVEEPMVELAGQAVAHQIHGDETKKNLHSYANLISNFLPRVWSSDVFKGVRKQGALGIGQEIAKQLTNGNVDFINKVYDDFSANNDKKTNSNRMKAIETKVLERTDKVEKIQNDTGVSEIANLVEELKRGTISLEGALNSSKYRELAAVLITKFLEDEDMEALEQLALSF